MTVYETEVPGVGQKYELELDGDRRLVVVVHHDGKREVFLRPSPDADSQRLFALDGERARQLGSILEGTYFQPLELDSARVPVGGAVIEWATVEEGSPLVGETLGEADIRQRTGTSVVAVQRGDETQGNPPPEFVLTAGDVLVAIGTRAEQDDLAALVAGDRDDGDGDDRDDDGDGNGE